MNDPLTSLKDRKEKLPLTLVPRTAKDFTFPKIRSDCIRATIVPDTGRTLGSGSAREAVRLREASPVIFDGANRPFHRNVTLPVLRLARSNGGFRCAQRGLRSRSRILTLREFSATSCPGKNSALPLSVPRGEERSKSRMVSLPASGTHSACVLISNFVRR